jgi:hypothetical protein
MGRMIDWIWNLPGWLQFLLVVVLLLYGVAPLLVWQTQKLSAKNNMYAVMPEILPAVVAQHFQAMAPQLAARGFQVAAYVHDPQQMVEAYIALWVNRTSGQIAHVGVIIGIGGLPMAKWIEFQTELADETIVETNNSSNLGIFVLPRNYHRLQFPGVNDPETLYWLHLWHESRWLDAQMPRFLPAPGAEVERLAYENLRTFKRQAAAGRMKEVNGVFAPTFMQAFRSTWMQCPPVLQIRKLRAWLRGRLYLKRALAGPPRQAKAVPVTDVHLVDAPS